jgi:PKD repeat protein
MPRFSARSNLIEFRARASRSQSQALSRRAQPSLRLLIALAIVWTVLSVPPGPLLASSPQSSGSALREFEPADFLDSRGGAATAAPAAQPPMWVNLTAGATPPGDMDAAMAYDPLSNASILFGGYLPTIGHLNEALQQINATWAFRNGTWTNITATVGLPPVGRLSPSLSYDARDGYLLLTGGYEISYPYNDTVACHGWCNDTWKFANGRWTQVPLPSLNPFEDISLSNGTPVDWDGSVAAYDSTDGYVLVQSAFDQDFEYGNTTQGRSWGYEGSNWTDLTFNATANTTAVSPNYQDPTLIDDPAAGGVLLFGGTRFTSGGNWGYYPSNETWLFAHGVWTNVTSNSTLAPPSDGYATPVVGAYDNATKSVVVYDPGEDLQGLVWEWKNFQWTNITPAAAAPYPRVFGPAVAWDSGINATVVFGGIRLNNENQYSNSTWSWTTEPAITDLWVGATPGAAFVNSPVQFNVTVVGGVPPFTYRWTFGDGATSSSASPLHSYSRAGNYNVQIAVTDSDGHSASSGVTVVVTNTRALVPTIAPDPTDAGVPTAFSAGASGGFPPGGGTFSWEFGDSASASSPNATHTYGLAGNYSPTVWWNESRGSGSNNTSGMSIVRSLHLQVNPSLGSPTVLARPADPYLGQLVNFSAKVSGGTRPYLYSWAFGDGGTGGNLANISHVYTTNGPFDAHVTITDALGATVLGSVNITTALNLSAFANVSFGAAPLPVGFVSHVTGGNPGYRFAWNFGDGGTSELSDPDHTFTAGGTYRATVVVTDQAGNAASNSWNVTVATGGGPVSVSLATGSPEIALGASDTISATVNGGQGAYAVRWTQVPAGCQEVGFIGLNCTPTTTGQFAVALSVTDAQGVSGTANTSFAVGSQFVVNPGGPPKLIDSAEFPWAAVTALVVAIALIAIVLGVVIGRRASRGSRSQPEAEDPRYAAYRSPAAEGGTPAASSASHPVDELF